MEIGMLWFDDSATPLAEKIQRAVGYYKEKFGRQPTLCLVNPATAPTEAESVSGVVLRHTPSVLPHHFWIGEGESQRQEQESRAVAA